MSDTYATAAYLALEDGMMLPDVLKRLVEVLEKRGHSKLYGGILRELEKKIAGAEEAKTTVRLADTDDEKVLKAEIAAALTEIGGEQVYELETDESLVGGFVLETKDRMVDASYKRSLLSLYRKFVT